MRIVAISDLHGVLPEIPDCDLCLIVGDIFPIDFDRDPERCHRWASRDLTYWLSSIPSKATVAVAGNHDFFIRDNPVMMRDYSFRWQLLFNESFTFDGLKIWGSPNVPVLSTWAFYASPAEEREIYGKIPLDTNILMTHTPPRGVGDRIWPHAQWVGSEALREMLTTDEFPDLMLHVFGHIHEDFGEHHWFGHDHKIFNTSIMDEHYDPVNPITIIDL